MQGERHKVLFVSHSAELGGGEIALELLVRGLEDTSPEMQTTILLLSDGPLVGRLQSRGFQPVVLPLPQLLASARRTMSPLRRLRAGLQLVRFARTREFTDLLRGSDVVYSNSQKAHLIVGIHKMISRPNYLWILHQREYLSKHTGLTNGLVLRLLARIANLTVCNSASTSRSVWSVSRSRKVIIPSPIDVETFRQCSISLEPRKRELYEILFLGSITPQKGIHVLLAALRELTTTTPVRVRIAGSARYGDYSYLDQIRREGTLLGRKYPNLSVELLGHLDNPALALASTSVLVAPSMTGEGLGQVVLQAMAAGTFVIASDVAGYRDLFEPGVHGLLVPPGDPAVLALALRLSMDRPTDEASATPDLSGYRPESVSKLTSQTLLDLIARHRARKGDPVDTMG